MKRLVILLFLVGFWAKSLAQKPTGINTKDELEIKLLAKQTVENGMLDLLNNITTQGVADDDIRFIIQNAFMPNNSQLFYDSEVQVEDDTRPQNTIEKRGKPLTVESYLTNLANFYRKTDNWSIQMSKVSMSEIKMGDYLYLKVYFEIYFGSRTNDMDSTIAYQPVMREAELQAKKKDGQWQVYISRIGFYRGTPDVVPDSTDSLRQAYQKRMNEALTEGEASISQQNDKKTALDFFVRASVYRNRYKLQNPKFEELYKQYTNKGDVIFEVELYDKAQKWYELAQTLNNTPEIEEKIRICKQRQ